MENEGGLRQEVVKLIDDVKSYLELRYDLLKLELIEKLALITTYLIVAIISIGMIFSFVLFMFIGLAFYLGELLKSNSLGFVSVGGIFFVIMILVFLLRNYIFSRPILQSLIKALIIEPKNKRKEKKEKNRKNTKTDKEDED